MITGYLLNMYKKFLSVRNGVPDARTASGPLSLLIKKINKENAPPDGWALPDKLKPSSKPTSSQAFKLDKSKELG
jgi:hypothetical protein